MRIPDTVLKCVCFLCVKAAIAIIDGDDTFRYGGTRFFVSVKSEKHANRYYSYFVTARHNVQLAGGPLYLRINTLIGASQHLEIPSHAWTYPEKNGVDLALMSWNPDKSLYDYKTVSSEVFTDAEIFETEGIGVGDELFCVGLFTYRHGANQNYPIVRSGIIASMPNEPFEDPMTAFTYDAYLAEVRSIGGLSGSPVFVRLPHVTYLLGVIRGHWDLKRRETSLGFDDGELRQVNIGMATVTPIEELSLMLESQQLKEERKKSDLLLEQNNAP
jgi:hypothetical protein